MFKKLLFPVLAAVLLVTGISTADQMWNLLQNRYTSANPPTSRRVTANYTAVAADRMIDCDTTSGAITVTLPTIVNTLGGNSASYTIRNIGTTGYAVTVTAATTDSITNTIEGVASRLLPSPLSGTSSTMSIALRGGYDWKVIWETPPFTANMLTGDVAIQWGRYANAVVSTPTTSVTLTYADCGKTYAVGTDALTFTLPSAASVGCGFKFINIGAAGNNLIDIKPNAADNFSGTVMGATFQLISSTTGSTLTNTKSTAQPGDFVQIITMATGSWGIVSGSTGTWTLK